MNKSEKKWNTPELIVIKKIKSTETILAKCYSFDDNSEAGNCTSGDIRVNCSNCCC